MVSQYCRVTVSQLECDICRGFLSGHSKVWRILFRYGLGDLCECCAAFKWCGVATSGEVMNASLVLIVANGVWDSLVRLIVLLGIRQAIVWYEKASFSRVELNVSKFTTYTCTCTILRERKSTINRFRAHYVSHQT